MSTWLNKIARKNKREDILIPGFSAGLSGRKVLAPPNTTASQERTSFQALNGRLVTIKMKYSDSRLNTVDYLNIVVPASVHQPTIHLLTRRKFRLVNTPCKRLKLLKIQTLMLSSNELRAYYREPKDNTVRLVCEQRQRGWWDTTLQISCTNLGANVP